MDSTAKWVLSHNTRMTIATSSLDGKPWISPVFFAYDRKVNLFWTSNKRARHSTLIRKNPRVAIVIFDSTAPSGKAEAIYLEALAHELTDEKEILHGMKTLHKRGQAKKFRVNSPQDVTGKKLWRMYMAVPQKASKLGHSKIINGQSIDQRNKISLK